jgi:hypothetical protein
MKKNVVFVWIALLLLSLSPVFPGTGSNKATETFLLTEDSPICLSFESYKEKDGWTPVVLSLGELECLLWMDEAGRVTEMRESGGHSVEPVCSIDVLAQSLVKDADSLNFEVYEQNNIRTRWRLSPGEPAGPAAKKILFREEGIDITLGNLGLRLNHAAWEFKELSPGVYRVEFHGPMVNMHRPLVYEKAAGIIYSNLGLDNELIRGQNRTWAMKNRESEGQIKGGYDHEKDQR